MNRRIRKATEQGRHHRARWLAQDHLRRCTARAKATIAGGLAPIVQEFAEALIREWAKPDAFAHALTSR